MDVLRLDETISGQEGGASLAVQHLRASHPNAQWVVLTAGEVAGSVKPVEDPSTVLRAALRQFHSSWPTVLLVATQASSPGLPCSICNLISRELYFEPTMVEAPDVRYTERLRYTCQDVNHRARGQTQALAGCEDRGLGAGARQLARHNRQRT